MVDSPRTGRLRFAGALGLALLSALPLVSADDVQTLTLREANARKLPDYIAVHLGKKVK